MTQEKQKPLKIKLGTFVTPFGEAVWPKLNAPSTKFKAEGQFSCDLRLSDSDVEPINAKMEAYRDEAVTKFKEIYPKKSKSIKAGRMPLSAETDKEGDETGHTILKTTRVASGTRKDGSKWAFKPIIKDAKNQLVKNPPPIWGGSEVRVATTVYGYIGQTDSLVGIKLEIEGVQIKKLVSGGEAQEANFDDVDEGGWTSEGSEDEGSDGSSGDDGDDGSDDF